MRLALLLVLSLCLALFGCTRPAEPPTPPSPTATVGLTATPTTETPVPQSPAPESPATPVNYRGMVPFPDVEAPSLTEVVTVKMITDAGELQIEVYPQAAPNAAARFIELCKVGFYNNTPIFRVVRSPEPFVAQFGVNWRKGMKEWKDRLFDDDPSLFRLERGTLAFAKAGPNTNSTQVFINFRDNSPLREQGFAAFGRVVRGMEVADRWKSVGSPDMGLDQEQLWTRGQEYLKSLQEKPNMILKMELVPAAGASPSPAGSPTSPGASPRSQSSPASPEGSPASPGAASIGSPTSSPGGPAGK